VEFHRPLRAKRQVTDDQKSPLVTNDLQCARDGAAIKLTSSQLRETPSLQLGITAYKYHSLRNSESKNLFAKVRGYLNLTLGTF
jgi:hypothetical protein